ncbi:hypothetical protein GGS21DRAFT_531686 [Xylaria nigripes]|nr:hypothetical protein GGS21DRAFT_531686 [Xylaria nigripes]
MARTKYHKFKDGERCDECGTHHWFAQDALRYCRNGHRLEGFAHHEADEDAFGTQGKVSRKKKEARSKVVVKLMGDEGRELYLEILQLILIRQARWLVDVQGLPDEITELVRALWTLRVRNLPLRERGGRSGERTGNESDSAKSQAVFSSQSETDESSDANLSDATSATWAPDALRRWKLPKLIDTLALCYLACLVRQLPITTGDFCTWAQKGDIDFLAALNHMPRNVRDRLPPQYHRALQVKDHIPAGRLQATVQHYVTSFKFNFDMILPPLNYVPIIIRLITDLVLPIEIYSVVKSIAEILKADFSYPVGGRRIRTMYHPEILLTSLVLVSTKLLYSLDGIARPPISPQDPRQVQFDWGVWQEITAEKPAGKRASLARGEEYKVTADDALSMAKTKMDDYMDWFEAIWLNDSEPKTPERVRNLFAPTAPRSDSHPAADTESRTDKKMKQYEALNRSMKSVHPTDTTVNEQTRHGNLCPVWRREADLPDAAKVLYGKAAAWAGIPLIMVIRGAVQIERQIEVWCMRETKAKHGRTSKDKGKGKGKAVAIAETSDESSDEDYF